MTPMPPPALATWILKQVVRDNDALVGDLLEEHRRRQSASWYWRQVLSAVAVAQARAAVIVVALAVLFVAGGYVRIPGAQATFETLAGMRAPANVSGPFRLFDLLQGGQMSGGTVFALGLNPYVSAAFLVQATALLWRWTRGHRLAPRGLWAWTWGIALVLCTSQALGLALFYERMSAAVPAAALVSEPGTAFRLGALVTLTAGTMCLMIISDQISRRRLGNGMLIVFVASMVGALPALMTPLAGGAIDLFSLSIMLLVNLALVGVVSAGNRRIVELA